MRSELGSRIDPIAARRVWGLPAPQNKQQQDFCGNLADPLSIVEPFETKTEHTKRGGSWVGEFWGKWMTAAALAYHYRPKDDSLKILKRSADRLMATQDASGYIGTYKPAHRYVSWETWCMKYTLLGLLAYHDETGDKAALAALTRLADDLLANVGPGKKPLGNCCNFSGPRAPMLLPRLAVMYGESGPVVNLYENGSATIPLQQGNRVRLVQTTEYPLEDAVTIAVRPEKAAEFAVKLRIPAWSARSEVAVNDAPQDIKAVPGTHLTLRRTWQPGDTIRLKLDLRGRIFQAPSGSGALAVLRGPLVLAIMITPLPEHTRRRGARRQSSPMNPSRTTSEVASRMFRGGKRHAAP
jgi:DUF1680 family protein